MFWQRMGENPTWNKNKKVDWDQISYKQNDTYTTVMRPGTVK